METVRSRLLDHLEGFGCQYCSLDAQTLVSPAKNLTLENSGDKFDSDEFAEFLYSVLVAKSIECFDRFQRPALAARSEMVWARAQLDSRLAIQGHVHFEDQKLR